MNSFTRGALIGSAALTGAAILAGTVSVGIPHSLIQIAFERKLPFTPGIRTKKLFSGCRDMERIERLCCENAAVLENGDCISLSINGRGGQRLVGHLHLSPSPKRTIIAMHGWRTTWARDFGAVSEFWHSNDCNVLYVEQRGQAQSEGRYIGFGITERFDCLSWIERLNREAEISRLPIYLCGVSMGASTVLMATGLELPKNVHGVIADCGFTSPHDVFKHVVNKNLHFPYGKLIERQVDRRCIRRLGLDPHEYSTLEAMQHCKIPVMFVHGGADRFVPVRMTYDNYRACASRKRMLIIPQADHGMCYFTAKVRYQREMLDFFSDCEAGAEGGS